jgi:hypothetical protein
MEEHGHDPRQLESGRFEDYAEWFQYRADVLTGFMERLRKRVREQEKELGRPCPIVARVPDSPRWLMLAYGLDLERWLEADLVDATMLSPFPNCVEDISRHPEYHVSLAHQYGKACFGGIGSLGLFGPHKEPDKKCFHPRPLYLLAHRQYEAGVDGMSLYQSETLVRLEHLEEHIARLGDKSEVKERAHAGDIPPKPAEFMVGMDWHAKPVCKHSLRTELCAHPGLAL